MTARARLLMDSLSPPSNRIRLHRLILPMKIPRQLPQMNKVKVMLHHSLKMRNLHFHILTWQSWMT